MTDPITTSYIATAYGHMNPVQRPVKEADGSFVETAKEDRITRSLYQYNAQMIEMSSEVFAQALQSGEPDDVPSVLDVQADAYDTQANAYNSYLHNEYRGSALNFEA